MIWIRVDANPQIGMGHLMRCLSMGEAFRDAGVTVRFLTADDQALELLTEHGFAFLALHTDYRAPEQELPLLGPMLAKERPSLFLADSYFVTAEYLRQVRQIVKTAYLDDCGTVPYPVDFLINYNFYADDMDYESLLGDGDRPGGTEYLLGPSYAPLRREFTGIPRRETRREAERVFVTTGGSDRFNLAGRFVSRALEDPDTSRLQYHVVSGGFNPHLPFLTALSDRHANVHIHQKVSHMASLMRDCDIAVSAGGSTVYELCAAGVPMLCFSFVENQRRIVESLWEKKLAAFGGNYEKEGDGMLGGLVQALKKLVPDEGLRSRLSQRGQSLVDGRGADRIAQTLWSRVQPKEG